MLSANVQVSEVQQRREVSATAGQTLKRFCQGFYMNSHDCHRKSGDIFIWSITTQALLLLLATYLQSSTKFRRLGEQKADVSSGFLNDQLRGTDALNCELFIALIPQKKKRNRRVCLL